MEDGRRKSWNESKRSNCIKSIKKACGSCLLNKRRGFSVCDEHLKPMVLTALHTGMRHGGILVLEWRQVDMQHGFILLIKTKDGERREIPIDNTMRALLHSLPRRIDCPYVFHNLEKLTRYNGSKRSIHTALKRAGITDFQFQRLASHLCKSTGDVRRGPWQRSRSFETTRI